MNKLKDLRLPLLPIFLSICIFCLSVGYAAINSITGEIIGKAYAYKQTGVFITDAVYYSDLYANKNNSKVNSFVKTTLNTSVELSSSAGNSAITYLVTMYNSSANDYTFDGVVYAEEFYDNPNIIYELDGIKEGDILNSGDYVSFYITYSYLNDIVSANNVLNSYLNFKFTEVSKGYGDLKIEYVLTEGWNDNTYQYYRADFTLTNTGTNYINDFKITIPFDDLSYNAGWGNGVEISNSTDPVAINIQSTSSLNVGGTVEFTLQFGVRDTSFDFNTFDVVIDGNVQEPDEPVTPDNPNPDPDEPDNPDPDEPDNPDEPEVEEPILPEVDSEGNYVYTLDGYTVKLIPANGWNDSVSYYTQFNVVITNTGSTQINNWKFTIDATNGIGVQQAWNLVYDDTQAGVIIVSNPTTGNMIAPGGSYTEGGMILKAPVNNYIPTLK